MDAPASWPPADRTPREPAPFHAKQHFPEPLIRGDALATVGLMPSLRCGHCEKLFEYRERIVALRDTDTGVVAEPETELEAGTVEGAFEPVGKYHVRCYETMQSEAPDNWPTPG
jgi:hypothetical protein